MDRSAKHHIETIVFGGGCFWCLEPIFNQIRGVLSAVVGYAGGHTENPVYEEVYSGQTGHAEVVKLDFDPLVISLEKLVEVFFALHDPTSLNRQGNDIGTQYRSIILTTNYQQILQIKKYIDKITKYYKNPIVTELKPLEIFYPAENYHQNYFQTNQKTPYCRLVINPKLSHFRKNFSDLLQ